MINKGNIANAIKELKSNKNNAVAHIFDKKTLNEGKGKLQNCIFTVKDNYADVNVNCKASSLLLNNFRPQYKATVIDLLEKAGAICAARTNLDEFGLGGSGEYSAFGKVLNPLNNKYLVGGSSSGAAATLTNNISFAIGSDTGDSVRKPASNIGKIGFKPSYGAISRYGLFAFATSMDTVAYFAHNINDLILISSVLYKQDIKHDLTNVNLSFDETKLVLKKPKKVAYLDCFSELRPYVKDAYNNLLEKLKKENIELIKITIPENILKSIDTVYRVIAFSEASSNLSNMTGFSFGNTKDGKSWEDVMLKTRSEGFGDMVQSRLILGSYFLEKDNQQKYFLKAQKLRRYLQNYFLEIHKKADLFIYPASNDSAPEDGKSYPDSYMDYILTYCNLVGNPSLTMFLGKNPNNNMPFNIALDTKIYDDVKLMEYALYFEKLIRSQNE